MVADRVKTLRETHGMTQAELSKRLGVTRAAVNAWELGISVPSTQFIVELSRLFHVSTDYLLCVDATVTVNASGLTETDLNMLNLLASHLRRKNQSEPS